MSEPLKNWLGMGAIIPARIIVRRRCVHRRGKSNASCSAGVAWSGSVAGPARLDASPFPFRIIIYRPFFPPVPSRMKIVVSMFDFGFRCNIIGPTDASPAQVPTVGRTFNIAFGLMCLPEPGEFPCSCCVRLASLAKAKGLGRPPMLRFPAVRPH
ncbi:hypothetical protein ZIOFF_060316 [Zingiber officinale]|uniref:Uncharacterized protein n=1 Tax=Zingiber officinale TaxID=94328 RepID=A0A8J5B8Z8_ZINOF|nr:hypothetical protein ZIOFF_075485 [Zingiber officinale]KAG6467666.1 hypothetical protein ZIOFF_074461 [Zingiber officinale]KAG6483664.1 hypothetical protein ZIOFF_060316 [Zingiber officinale]